jgi:hypothetical protein
MLVYPFIEIMDGEGEMNIQNKIELEEPKIVDRKIDILRES